MINLGCLLLRVLRAMLNGRCSLDSLLIRSSGAFPRSFEGRSYGRSDGVRIIALDPNRIAVFRDRAPISPAALVKSGILLLSERTF